MTRKRRGCGVIGTVLVWLFVAEALAAVTVSQAPTEDVPKVESILDSMISQSRLLPPYVSRSVSTLTWLRAEGRGTDITESESRWDGLRSDLLSNRFELVENEKVPTFTHRTLWNGEYQVSMQVSVRGPDRRLQVVGLSRGEERRPRLGRGLGGCMTPYGGSEESLVALLRGAFDVTVKPQSEALDGHSCYVLEATTQVGHLRVWIDPQAGFNVRKIVSHRAQQFGSSEEIVDEIEIRMVSGVWMPMSAIRHRTGKDADARINNDVTVTERRTQIEFNPDFDKIGAFEMAGIPDGTRVVNSDAPGIAYVWRNGAPVPLGDASFESLTGKPLPSLEGIARGFDPTDSAGKMLLVCFCDVQQRPSRNCLVELKGRGQPLQERGVAVVAIQAVKMDQAELDHWTRENAVAFVKGMIEEREGQTRNNWGVKSLPWLILTDGQHIVRAEGVDLRELDERIFQVGR